MTNLIWGFPFDSDASMFPPFISSTLLVVSNWNLLLSAKKKKLEPLTSGMILASDIV